MKEKLIIFLLMPMVMAIEKILTYYNYGSDTIVGASIILVLMIIAINTIYKFRKDIIKRDWNNYKTNKKYILLSIISAGVSLLIITLVKGSMSKLNLLSAIEQDFTIQSSDKLVFLLGGLIPTLIPFIEEPVFRHEIYYDNRSNSIVKNIFFAVLSSILFGFIHIGNYQSILQTVPLMFVGLYYCIIYRLTNNIFTSIIAHVIYNGSLALLPAIILIILG